MGHSESGLSGMLASQTYHHPLVTTTRFESKESKPELLSASVDQFLIESVDTSTLGFNLLEVLFHLLPPFSLMRAQIC